MSDFAFSPRPPVLAPVHTHTIPDRPLPSETQRVQPVGPVQPSALPRWTPRDPEFPLRNLPKDRVAPPSLMQLQIGAWLEEQANRQAEAAEETPPPEAPDPATQALTVEPSDPEADAPAAPTSTALQRPDLREVPPEAPET